MHVLVATAGALPPATVVQMLQPLAGGDGSVTVMTCLEVPREFLEELAGETWQPFSEDPRTPAIEQAVAQYVEERGARLVEPMVAALIAADLVVQPLFVETADPAQAIVETAVDEQAHLIVMGATRPLFDASAWESVSMHVMQRSKVPLLLIPGAARPADDPRAAADR